MVSARAEARASANVGQSVGPLLRIGSTSAPRKASVVGHLSSGSKRTSGFSIRLAQVQPIALTKLSLPGIWATATVWQCKPKKRSTPRRLTLPSSGQATACHAWPSFHSGPSPRRLREPLMSNVRRLRADRHKSPSFSWSERALKVAPSKSRSVGAAKKRRPSSTLPLFAALNE